MAVSDTLGLVVPTPLPPSSRLLELLPVNCSLMTLVFAVGILTIKLLESGTANPELAGPDTDWLPAISVPLSRAWTETVVLALLPTAPSAVY